VALLVHNDYASELKTHLQRFKVQTKEDFGPCDGSILIEIKYDNHTKQERDIFEFIHHCDRIKHVLIYIRALAKAAVAYYFYNKGWVDQSTLTEAFPPKLSQIADPFYVDQDMDKSFSDPNNNISQLE
jgi:hypothetical protein